MATKITNQKYEILNYLKSVKTHPTAEEVYQAVRKKLPRISLGTVYRNLNQLSGNKEIVKLDLEKARFDANLPAQDHLICKSCKKIIDIPPHPVKISEYRKKFNFRIESISTYFYGCCAECAKR